MSSNQDSTCTSQHGHSLPTVLVLSTLASFLLAHLLAAATGVLAVGHDYTVAMSARRTLLESPITTHSKTTECIPLSGSNRRLCLSQPRPYRSLPMAPAIREIKNFDLSPFLKGIAPCPVPPAPSSTSRGVLPTHPALCRLTSVTTSELLVSDSLEATRINLKASSPEGISLLFARGDLSITGELSLLSDTVVLALGHIAINKISAGSRRATRTTIISLTGSVTIKSKEPALFPLILARGDIRSPLLVLNGPYPLPNESKQPRSIGLTAG